MKENKEDQKKVIKEYSGTDLEVEKMNEKQILFLEYYLSPKSPTYMNMTRSAIKAGYAPSYAKNMSCAGAKWVGVLKTQRKLKLKKAEEVLEKTLDDYDNDKRLAQDTAKFIARTLGKAVYSEKQEVEHSGGISIEIVKYGDKLGDKADNNNESNTEIKPEGVNPDTI